MRAFFGTAALAACVLLTLLELGVTEAVAADAFCHPTGDYCTSVAKVRGKRFLRVGTFSFRGSVRMCVTPPRGKRECVSRRLEFKSTGFFLASARWSSWFTNHGRGSYRVSFYAPADAGSVQLGPFLHFRR